MNKTTTNFCSNAMDPIQSTDIFTGLRSSLQCIYDSIGNFLSFFLSCSDFTITRIAQEAGPIVIPYHEFINSVPDMMSIPWNLTMLLNNCQVMTSLPLLLLPLLRRSLFLWRHRHPPVSFIRRTSFGELHCLLMMLTLAVKRWAMTMWSGKRRSVTKPSAAQETILSRNWKAYRPP